MSDTQIIQRPEPAPLAVLDNKLATMSADQIDNMIAVMDKAADARQRIFQACLRRAQPDDFIDFDGKPYLEGEGADRIAATVGIQLGRPLIEVRTVGDDIFVEVVGEATWPMTGAIASEFGSCSTRDKFFSGRDGDSATMSRLLESANGDRKLAAEMLAGHVKKKAIANWKSRVVSAVLGVKGLTWADLEKLGLNRSQSGAAVQFKKGSNQSVKQQQSQPDAPAPFLPLAEAAKAAPGSNVSTSAIIKTIAKANRDKASWYATVYDGPVEVKVSGWGDPPDWAAVNANVHITRMEIVERAGTRYFNVKTWELLQVEDGIPQ